MTDIDVAYGPPCGVTLAFAGLVCVLPSEHPGRHATRRGESWGRLRSAADVVQGGEDESRVTRPCYGDPCGADRWQKDAPSCVLPKGHPGLHSMEGGECWGRTERSTWEHEPERSTEFGYVHDAPDDGADFQVAQAGDHVRLIPLSTRALEWFWGATNADYWPYFHYRAYADTGLGWFDAPWDAGFKKLLAELKRKKLVVDYGDH